MQGRQSLIQRCNSEALDIRLKWLTMLTNKFPTPAAAAVLQANKLKGV
jgi:hypothetical protein